MSKPQWSRRNSAPVIFLDVDGKDADDIRRLLVSFKFKRELKKATEITLVFRNDDLYNRLEDDSRFFPNHVWNIRFGFLNDLSPVIVGLVRNVEPEYALKRQVTLTLHDASVALMQTSSKKNWGVVPASEIAKKIAAAHRLEAVVEASPDKPKKAYVQPGDVNDIQYLRDLAADIDFEVFVAGNPQVLYFRKKPYSSSPVEEFNYYFDQGENQYVLSFKPKVKSLGPLKSGAAGTDTKKKDDKANKNASDDAAVVQFEGPGGGTQYFPPGQNNGITTPTANASNVGGLAQAARQQMLDHANEASSKHPLTPSLEAGKNYVWSGLSKQLNGKWYCQSVTHTITGTGSSTEAEWKRPSKDDKSNKNGKNDKKANDDNNAPAVQLEGPSGYAQYFPPTSPPPTKK